MGRRVNTCSQLTYSELISSPLLSWEQQQQQQLGLQRAKMHNTVKIYTAGWQGQRAGSMHRGAFPQEWRQSSRAAEHPLSWMSMGGLPGSTGRRAAHSPSRASSGELLSAGQENPRTDMLTHCICNASHWLLSLWESQRAWHSRTASCAGRNMRQGDAPSHDSKMFLRMGRLLGFLPGEKKNQSFQFRTLCLMVTSVEMQINLFFPQRRWKREIEVKSLEKLTKTNKRTNRT